jgi:hypothetical protein
MIHDIYIEQEGEEYAPPGKLLRVGLNPAARIGGKPDGEFMPATIFLAIGDYDEATESNTFKASLDQQFAVEAEVLVKALIGLGALSVGAFVPDKVRNARYER